MIVTLLFAVVILLICVALLSIKLLLKKNGEFPHIHIDGNKMLNSKGIRCAKVQDKEARKRRNLIERKNG